MPTEKSFYKNASVTSHTIFVLGAALMAGISIYLTSHYYHVKFPSGITGGSLCNVNNFFNCDTVTHSKASNIAGVPLSLFGAMVGIFALFGYLFQNAKVEGVNRILLLVNASGCLLLLFYGLFFLGVICPFCFIYYLGSFSVAFIIWKYSNLVSFHPLPMGIYLAITLVVAGISYNHTSDKTKKKNENMAALMRSYDSLNFVGNPPFESDYRLVSSTDKFGDAPLQITKFSDFECPACRSLSDNFHKVVENQKYRGKINIQYFFYPLDRSCNPSMKIPLHRHACQASYLAACLPNKFAQVERKIFSMQEELSTDLIRKIAKEEGVLPCLDDEQTKAKVISYIEAADAYNVRSTPTWLLNGRKIEASLPLASIETILDALLERSKK